MGNNPLFQPGSIIKPYAKPYHEHSVKYRLVNQTTAHIAFVLSIIYFTLLSSNGDFIQNICLIFIELYSCMRRMMIGRMGNC